MYYNKNIKSLLFDFKSDVNYISILIIGILKGFECGNKRSSFKDFRKINLIITFLLNNEDVNILNKFLDKAYLSNEEYHILSLMYFKSRIEESTFNIAIIMLENKEIITFYKINKLNSIYLNHNKITDTFDMKSSFKKSIEFLIDNKEKVYNWNYNNLLKEITTLKGDNMQNE